MPVCVIDILDEQAPVPLGADLEILVVDGSPVVFWGSTALAGVFGTFPPETLREKLVAYVRGRYEGATVRDAA